MLKWPVIQFLKKPQPKRSLPEKPKVKEKAKRKGYMHIGTGYKILRESDIQLIAQKNPGL